MCLSPYQLTYYPKLPLAAELTISLKAALRYTEPFAKLPQTQYLGMSALAHNVVSPTYLQIQHKQQQPVDCFVVLIR